MKKSIIVVALFTVASQGIIHTMINNSDLLVAVVIACMFVVQGLVIYVLTDRESFKNGLEASKEANKVEALVSRQVNAALGLVKETAKTKKSSLVDTPVQERKGESFHKLEITGLD